MVDVWCRRLTGHGERPHGNGLRTNTKNGGNEWKNPVYVVHTYTIHHSFLSGVWQWFTHIPKSSPQFFDDIEGTVGMMTGMPPVLTQHGAA